MEQKRLTLSEYDAIVAFDRLCFPQDHWTEEDWPAYRGRRLAAGLLCAATELLQAAGLPRICGETRLSNEAMRRTFAACGYRLTRIEEAYYDHPPESACKYERQFEK